MTQRTNTAYGELFPVGPSFLREKKTMAGFNGTPKPSRSKPSGPKRAKPMAAQAETLKKGKKSK